MGRWVNIWKGAADGIEGHLTPRLGPFNVWYTQLEEEPNDLVNCRVRELLDGLVSGVPHPIVRTRDEAIIVDRLVADFYGFYCDTEGSAEFEPIKGPSLYVRRYEELAPWVSEVLGARGEELWVFLLRGRGIWRGAKLLPFEDDGDEYFVSYLTLSECHELAPLLASAAPPASSQVEAYDYVAAAIQLAAHANHGLIMTSG